MAQYLLFQLHGPMAAWGGVAVGEIRPSAAAPTRSAVFGLVAACLGIRRDQEAELAALCAGYHLALRVDAPGSSLIDYHTIQNPAHRAKRVFHCRRDELGQMLDADEEPETILSSREYLLGAAATACVWPVADNPPHPLERLAQKLAKPAFIPFLGRRSCPAALPFRPVIVDAKDPAEALGRYHLEPLLRVLLPTLDQAMALADVSGRTEVHGRPAPWIAEERTERDVCERFGRRQFGLRRVGVGRIAAGLLRQEG